MNLIYKMTKDSTCALIGREECLHESMVNMVVTSRCFAFRALILIMQAQI